MKKIIYIILILFITNFSFSQEEYIQAKIISLISEEKADKENDGVEKILKYKVKILEGKEKNKIKKVEFPIYKEKQYNIYPSVGSKIVLYKSLNTENGTIEKTENEFYISDVDKRDDFYYMIFIFAGLMLLIAKKKGIKSILALFTTIIFLIKIFIPAISMGYSPILFAVITSIFSSLVTIYFILGFNKKFIISILGTVGGVTIAGFISYIFIHRMRLTGYLDTEVLSYANLLKNINLRELISAGVIIGSLGAVMDVAVSIASSINEIYENNREIKEKTLLKSSMKIGSDIIGTMTNTLILAYIGASLLTLILLYLQADDYPLIRILNYENIAVEILSSLCGSIGIIVAIPITSYIGIKIIKDKK